MRKKIMSQINLNIKTTNKDTDIKSFKYGNLIEDLITLYNNKLTYNKLVFKYMRWYRWIFGIITLIYISAIITYSYFLNDFLTFFRIGNISVTTPNFLKIFGVIVYILLMIVFPIRESSIIRKYYKNSLDYYRIEEILKILDDKNRFNYEKLNGLIQAINNLNP